MNNSFNKLIAVPIVLIIISVYLLGINLYNRIDRVDDIKDAVPQSVGTLKSVEQEDEELSTINDKINLNTATESELILLDGIGEVLAKRIIAKREAIGGYKSIEQLLEVEGIGMKVFDGIKNYLVIE